MLVTAVINLGVAIPSSPGFIGTYQWLAVSSLALFGVGATEALAFGVLMQAVWYVPTTLVGGALLLRRASNAASRAASPAPSGLEARMDEMRRRSAVDRRHAGASRLPGLLNRVRGSTARADVALVGAVALVLGLIRLGTPSLWLDESLTATGNPIATFTDGYHWLYYSLEWPWRHVVGSSEWDLRFPSVVGSMLACGLLVVLGHRLFGRSVGLVERAPARDQPLRRQVVAAGTRIHAAARGEPRRDAPAAPRARARDPGRLGSVRSRLRVRRRLASGRRLPPCSGAARARRAAA